ncbi:MAG: thioredoxin domain-containing protein [Myxococcota bacterium]|jgi:protein-disulfide isomerase|nr:thioredoxin domain-containing protein [Myxococcota bacterium]
MRAKNATILIAIAALVGLVDAVTLTWDHQVHRVNPKAQSSVCGPGEGCEIARFHPLSEISLGEELPGLPISLLALGAYLAFLSLALRRWRFRQERDAPRLLLAMAIIGGLYSCFLAFISMMVQGSLCKLCSVLYVVNFVIFLSAVVGLGESAASWFSYVIGSIKSRAGAAAVVPMVAALIGGYALYAPPVAEAYAARLQALMDEAANLPSTDPVTVDVSQRPAIGPADAPVHLVEFADFGCGHCRQLYHQVHTYMAEHPGVLRMSFVNYPLDKSCNPAIPQSFHPNACMLAAASECAHQQDRWDTMAHQLFEQGPWLDQDGVLTLAGALGLDLPAFSRCLAAPETGARVLQDAELGIAAGVDGTPTFLLNGRRVIGGRPPKVFAAMVDAIREAR